MNSNTIILGGTHISAGLGSNVIIGQNSARNGVLEEHVVPEALHNSGESNDPTRCHPSTRIALLETLWQQMTGADSRSICWLFGPAGCGKSTIMRTLADRLEEQGFPLASFFFFHSSPRRNSAKWAFIATIAYQIASRFPEIRPLIERRIPDDPLVFSKNLDKQLRSIIIEPIIESGITGAGHAGPTRLSILIDGLDECSDKDEQIYILDILRSLVNALPTFCIVLVASRPEYHIRCCFDDEPLSNMFKGVGVLDSSFSPTIDIRRYLIDEFARILRRHPMRRVLVTTHPNWPGDEAIALLVQEASGQFIYAVTVIKFVQSTRHNPAKRLFAVMQHQDAVVGEVQPFEVLDNLYTTILSSVDPEMLDDTLSLLGKLLVLKQAIHLAGHTGSVPLGSLLTEELLSLPRGSVDTLLLDLHSLIHVPEDPYATIDFYHKSFEDYIFRRSRSGRFCIRKADVEKKLLLDTLLFFADARDASKILSADPLDFPPKAASPRFPLVPNAKKAGSMQLPTPVQSVDVSQVAAACRGTLALNWIRKTPPSPLLADLLTQFKWEEAVVLSKCVDALAFAEAVYESLSTSTREATTHYDPLLGRIRKLCCQLMADSFAIPWHVSPVFLLTTHRMDCCDRSCAACGAASRIPNEGTATYFSGSRPFGIPRIVVASFSRSLPYGLPRTAVPEVCGTSLLDVYTSSQLQATMASLNELPLGRQLECLEEIERHLRPMYAKGALRILDWIQTRSERFNMFAAWDTAPPFTLAPPISKGIMAQMTLTYFLNHAEEDQILKERLRDEAAFPPGIFDTPYLRDAIDRYLEFTTP